MIRLCHKLGAPPPGRGSIGGLRPPFLACKNADALHRLCAGAKRQAVGWGSAKRDDRELTPTRLPPIKSAVADLPLSGGGEPAWTQRVAGPLGSAPALQNCTAWACCYCCGILVLLLLILAGGPGASAAAQPAELVRNFVGRLIDAHNDLFASESDEEARRKCRRMLGWAFDLAAMVQHALGDAWNRAKSDEQRTFRAAFEDLIIASYVRQVARQRGATLTFTGVRQGEDRLWLAATQQMEPGKPERILIWRLRATGESWRAFDVLNEGRSMLARERDEYARILEENNGDLGAVIEFIRRRSQQPAR
jgi:ABC-type transporter MlaC component